MFGSPFRFLKNSLCNVLRAITLAIAQWLHRSGAWSFAARPDLSRDPAGVCFLR